MKTAAIAGFVMSIIMYSITSAFGCPTGFFSYIALLIFCEIVMLASFSETSSTTKRSGKHSASSESAKYGCSYAEGVKLAELKNISDSLGEDKPGSASWWTEQTRYGETLSNAEAVELAELKNISAKIKAIQEEKGR